MRDFSWKYFSMTGDVNAYMLYKEAVGSQETEQLEEEERLEAQEVVELN